MESKPNTICSVQNCTLNCSSKRAYWVIYRNKVNRRPSFHHKQIDLLCRTAIGWVSYFLKANLFWCFAVSALHWSFRWQKFNFSLWFCYQRFDTKSHVSIKMVCCLRQSRFRFYFRWMRTNNVMHNFKPYFDGNSQLSLCI